MRSTEPEDDGHTHTQQEPVRWGYCPRPSDPHHCPSGPVADAHDSLCTNPKDCSSSEDTRKRSIPSPRAVLPPCSFERRSAPSPSRACSRSAPCDDAPDITTGTPDCNSRRQEWKELQLRFPPFATCAAKAKEVEGGKSLQDCMIPGVGFEGKEKRSLASR